MAIMPGSQSSISTSSRYAGGQSLQALRMVAVCVSSVILAMGLTWILQRLFGKPNVDHEGLYFPPAFAFSTLILFSGSASLSKALSHVKREQQKPFRKWLLASLVLGSLFIGVQCYALWSLFPTERTYESASVGVTAFVLCLATLHAIHFFVATMFLSLIVIRSWSDRYDHEYFWGVRACFWFWHFLGVVWIAILAVIAIAI
ncbi:Cytochrome c oxidase subunit 3 [Thalassoglobus neptunius]|uniref:Cytochrome c oxidase subunit 3 n=2 Tax=Thalassoglobus neptunius TaxID=1938619 RepID=A0A5C5WPT1_9PLAN|nr:Cytochrome c oxidase subunit 3 [Thalassoglobus neptunius]